MTYYLLFILYLFYSIEVMLDKKQIQMILFEFKMCHKTAETTWKVNNAFGSGTANKCNSAVVVQEVLQRRLEP